MATLSNPDREIVLLRVVGGVSIPDIVTALGVTPAAIGQALSALQPAATADGAPPATRQRVVLLPHARAEPTKTELATAAQEGHLHEQRRCPAAPSGSEPRDHPRHRRKQPVA
ncbi:MAG: sigma-70 region 4 domain-containing protein [Actinobacteria bacterium]|nr:sigma-70 region 4 domain-containing protein [Actinomycetota bacterium]